MIADSTASAQKLIETYIRFRKLHWRQAQDTISGISNSEVIVLSYLTYGGEGLKVSELSNALNVASPTVTQQITSLESRGFVERSIDKEDRRAVRIKLTEKGFETQQKAFGMFLTTVRGLVEYLGEEDSNKLSELMVKVFTYFTEVRETRP